jgi:hypothetical protein
MQQSLGILTPGGGGVIIMENRQLNALRTWASSSHQFFEAFSKAREAGFDAPSCTAYRDAAKQVESAKQELDAIVALLEQHAS